MIGRNRIANDQHVVVGTGEQGLGEALPLLRDLGDLLVVHNEGEVPSGPASLEGADLLAIGTKDLEASQQRKERLFEGTNELALVIKDLDGGGKEADASADDDDRRSIRSTDDQLEGSHLLVLREADHLRKEAQLLFFALQDLLLCVGIEDVIRIGGFHKANLFTYEVLIVIKYRMHSSASFPNEC